MSFSSLPLPSSDVSVFSRTAFEPGLVPDDVTDRRRLEKWIPGIEEKLRMNYLVQRPVLKLLSKSERC
jgi:hypothetical protein